MLGGGNPGTWAISSSPPCPASKAICVVFDYRGCLSIIWALRMLSSCLHGLEMGLASPSIRIRLPSLGWLFSKSRTEQRVTGVGDNMEK
jgi:hypothetical protein